MKLIYYNDVNHFQVTYIYVTNFIKMKNILFTGIKLALIVLILPSCSTLNHEETPQKPVDLVCGMKVDKREAFAWKYDKKKYYFDSYNCKQAFQMNPEKFINNKCVIPNDTISK